MSTSAVLSEPDWSRAVRGLAVVVVAIAASVLLGWLLRIDILIRLHPDFIAMKANAALGLVLAGLGLYTLSGDSLRLLRLRRICAAGIGLLGALSLFEHGSGLDLGIDQLLARDHSAALRPGLMGFATAVNLVLVGLALMLIDWRAGRVYPAQYAALLIGMNALLVLIAYLNDLNAPASVWSFRAVAPHAALAFVLVSAGLLLARPGRGFMAWLTQTGSVGRQARYLLLGIVLVPIGLDWLTNAAHHAGWFTAPFAAAMHSTGSVLLLLLILAELGRRSLIEEVRRQRAEAELCESELRFRQLAENLNEVTILKDLRSGELLYVSPAYEQIWGRSRASLYAEPLSWRTAIHPDDRAGVEAALAERGGKANLDVEYRIVHTDGELRWIHSRAVVINDAGGEPWRRVAISTDITAHHQRLHKAARMTRLHVVKAGIASAALRQHTPAEFAQVACQIVVEVGGFDSAWLAETQAAQGGLRSLGYAEKKGRPAGQCSAQPCGHITAQECLGQRALSENRIIFGDGGLRPGPGTKKPLACGSVIALPVPRLAGAGEGAGAGSQTVLCLGVEAVSVFDGDDYLPLTDIAGVIGFGLREIARDQRIAYLASTDTLTGLPNRSQFLLQLGLLVAAAREVHQRLIVLVLDIEHFKALNDYYGRTGGDSVLIELVRRWHSALYEPYCLARIGPDQFAVAVSELPDQADASTILRDRLITPLQAPLLIDGQPVSIALRAGIALFPFDGEEAETLLTHAESALKQAKARAERFQYFDRDTQRRVTTKLRLETEMQQALARQQFVLHYQPKLDLQTGQIIAAEALLRWHHPERGLVPPAEFIPLAEETGLIVALGDWVLATVCAQLALWRRQHYPVVPVAVNVSALQVRKGGLPERVRQLLEQHQLPASLLELELTESVMMEQSETRASLQALARLGLSLALDDFGTGYSSLAYLQRFPFHLLKIDRCFVTDITRTADDAAIASGIIALAHRLGLRVLAEGVETEAQMLFLRRHGCDQMQGYFFSRPLPADDFIALVASRRQLQLIAPVSEDNTLLLVDDEPSILSSLRRLLRPDGYRLLFAASAEEALELLALHPVQVIVSDQRMPGLSGVEFLNVVKAMYPDTMRIILSGEADFTVLLEAINRGAVYKFLPKPWNDELLRDNIRDAFRRYRPARAQDVDADANVDVDVGADTGAVHDGTGNVIHPHWGKPRPGH